MIRIDIPGFRSLALAHLVLDYNGTLALVTRLGADAVVAIGNGRNDRMMLKGAALVRRTT